MLFVTENGILSMQESRTHQTLWVCLWNNQRDFTITTGIGVDAEIPTKRMNFA
jgi:hypothetical protein